MYAVLPLPYESREVVSDKPSAQVKHTKSCMKIMGNGAMATTNNTIIGAKDTMESNNNNTEK